MKFPYPFLFFLFTACFFPKDKSAVLTDSFKKRQSSPIIKGEQRAALLDTMVATVLSLTNDLGGADVGYLRTGTLQHVSDLIFISDLITLGNTTCHSRDDIKLYDNHLYHFADYRYKFSYSNLLVLHKGTFKVFKNLSCPKQGNTIQDVLDYISAAEINYNASIIQRLRNLRKHGCYHSTSLVHPAYDKKKWPDCEQ